MGVARPPLSLFSAFSASHVPWHTRSDLLIVLLSVRPRLLASEGVFLEFGPPPPRPGPRTTASTPRYKSGGGPMQPATEFRMKIVAIDWIMTTPQPVFDVTWCSFLGHACRQVPLVRFFGALEMKNTSPTYNCLQDRRRPGRHAP